MTIKLLPDSFDDMVEDAVRTFWLTRGGVNASAGMRDGRAAVVGGKNMDGFIKIVRQVVTHCGLQPQTVHVRRSPVVLRGYFRATKNWDVLVIDQKRLIGVFEFKSQVGSFGNNFNNRSEEVIGSAADLWVAHHHGAYGDAPKTRNQVRDEPPSVLNPTFTRTRARHFSRG